MSGRTVVSFLLDETGSMDSAIGDTIGGFNQYVDGLKDEDEAEFDFFLVKFNSRKTTKVYEGVPISDVDPLTEDDYHPSHTTPLVDACMKVIQATEEKVDEDQDAIVIFQTDGKENASQEYTFKELAAEIKEKENEGWEFVFLGAEIDSYETSQKMGISHQNAASYDKDKSGVAMRNLSANTADVASGNAQSMDFSASQRDEMGDDQYNSGSQISDSDSNSSSDEGTTDNDSDTDDEHTEMTDVSFDC